MLVVLMVPAVYPLHLATILCLPTPCAGVLLHGWHPPLLVEELPLLAGSLILAQDTPVFASCAYIAEIFWLQVAEDLM